MSPSKNVLWIMCDQLRHRYMRSHGSHWNGWPLRVDHLDRIGVRNVLVGKTDDLRHYSRPV
jgi:hypothetical protein